jgi:hypothetical protein
VPSGLFESLLLITAISIRILLNTVDVHNQSNAMGWSQQIVRSVIAARRNCAACSNSILTFYERFNNLQAMHVVVLESEIQRRESKDRTLGLSVERALLLIYMVLTSALG